MKRRTSAATPQSAPRVISTPAYADITVLDDVGKFVSALDTFAQLVGDYDADTTSTGDDENIGCSILMRETRAHPRHVRGTCDGTTRPGREGVPG